MSCRKALCALEARELVRLPEAVRRISARVAPHDPCLRQQFATVKGELSELGAIELQLIAGGTTLSADWNGMMDAHHPQGSGPLCGAQLRYLIISSRYGVIGGLAVSSAAWRLTARDKWLGWSDAERGQHLSGIVCNSRFLIVPTVSVKNLGSRVLGLLTRRLRSDWMERYGYAPWLMETYVEECRPATVYRAANWIEVGKTAGRGRQDVANQAELTRKKVLLFPLCTTTLSRLCGRRERAPISWMEREFGDVALGDRRLRERLLDLAGAFYARPTGSIPEACGTFAKTKAAYRFFDNKKITMDLLLESHLKATWDRARKEPVVLAVQDTSTLDYATHAAMQGLGPIHHNVKGAQGLFLHTAQAFSPEGLPLGLLDVQVWARDAAKPQGQNQSLPIKQKESNKWLRALSGIHAAATSCPDTKFVVVADREADIFEFMHAARDKELPFLFRSKNDRHLLPTGKKKTSSEVSAECEENAESVDRLWLRMQSVPEAGIVEMTVPRQANSAARIAQMSVRFAELTLKPPKLCSTLPPLTVFAVWTQEIPDPGAETRTAKPLEWMLLTSLPVTTLEEATEKVQWYTRRWGIEVYHRILKTGCRIEDHQLSTEERLEACLAIDMVVAWRIQHLTYLSRSTPDIPCTVAFTDSEWKAVVAMRTRTSPEKPPTLLEMVRHVACLGGFLARKSDGHPGSEVLWRGLQRMHDIVLAFDLFKELSSSGQLQEYTDNARKKLKQFSP